SPPSTPRRWPGRSEPRRRRPDASSATRWPHYARSWTMTDLESRVAAAPAVGRPPVLPDGDVGYALHETPVGTLLLATAGGRVVASSFGDEQTVTLKLANAISPRVLRQAQAHD